MTRPGPNDLPKKPGFVFCPTRREFLRLSALGAMAAAVPPVMASPLTGLASIRGTRGRGKAGPGEIVILHDPRMLGHEAVIDLDQVEQNVHLAVRTLTGIGDTGAAFESLFPGLSGTSTIAIKVNLIGPCDTRWETVRGVVSGLSQMLEGTYNVGQVTVFDRHSMSSHGYDVANFTFDGNHPVLSSTNSASGSGYEPVAGYELSQFIMTHDYVINVPVLKSHYDSNNQITVALKNHYGSCSPSSLCGNIPGMLTLNADSYIKDKTRLVITDCLRATYSGGPTGPAQTWNTYTEGTPNTLLVTTDPVTNDYWARDIINAERTARGLAARPCTWVELASGIPYFLGVSDPFYMTVISLDPYLDVETDRAGIAAGATFLAPNVPNPFSHHTAIRFRLQQAGPVALTIFDASGRRVRRMDERHFPGGYGQAEWDGRDMNGRKAAPGVYFVRMEAGGTVQTRRIVMVR